jgi:hypothetical protein
LSTVSGLTRAGDDGRRRTLSTVLPPPRALAMVEGAAIWGRPGITVEANKAVMAGPTRAGDGGRRRDLGKERVAGAGREISGGGGRAEPR